MLTFFMYKYFSRFSIEYVLSTLLLNFSRPNFIRPQNFSLPPWPFFHFTFVISWMYRKNKTDLLLSNEHFCYTIPLLLNYLSSNLFYFFYFRPNYRYPYYDEHGHGKLLYGYGGPDLYQYKSYSPLEGIH